MSVVETLTDYLAAVQAGFDVDALRPPAAGAGEVALLKAQPQAVRALTVWCLTGAVPHTRDRLTVATLRGTLGTDPVTLMGWTDAFARQIDGGIRLDALPGRTAGLAWRLRTKLQDAQPWRTRQPDDPWDAGWAHSTPAALRRLQFDWMPRRATLVLADVADHEALRLALGALWQRRARFQHPVRWLWVGHGGEVPAAPGQPLARFQLA